MFVYISEFHMDFLFLSLWFFAHAPFKPKVKETKWGRVFKEFSNAVKWGSTGLNFIQEDT